VTYLFVTNVEVEPNDNLRDVESNQDVVAVADTTGSPEKLDRFTFGNIVIGAFIDNIGSLGIVREYLYPAFAFTTHLLFTSDAHWQSSPI
jgi:hypothetical protein